MCTPPASIRCACGKGGKPGYPDLLGQLFPHAHLMEAGGVHMTAFGFQHGPFCRVVVLAQNRFDQPADLRMNFDGNVDEPLAAKVPGGGIIMAWRDQTLGEKGGRFKTRFKVSASESGNLVRLGRRNLLGNNAAQRLARVMSRGAAGAAMDALASATRNEPMQVVFADLEGKLPVDLAPEKRLPAGEVEEVTADWKVEKLWEPRSKTDATDATRALC